MGRGWEVVAALGPLVVWGLVWCIVWRGLSWRCFFRTHQPQVQFHRKAMAPDAVDAGEREGHPLQRNTADPKRFRVNRKPEWVIAKVLNLKAHRHKSGCRKVAQGFNQKHGPQYTVSKSFVAKCLKRNQYALQCLRREIKSKKPFPAAVNATWAMDLTFQATSDGQQQTALGIIDHGSRSLLCLQTLTSKNSWTLLGQLCLAIGHYGKPKAIRTDNEPVFTSNLFKLFLTVAGIKHQRIAPRSPWQNGRIERFFGTLKPLLKQLVIPGQAALQTALDEFRLFYNHVRTHQNLDGLTAQAWNKLTWADLEQNPPKK